MSAVWRWLLCLRIYHHISELDNKQYSVRIKNDMRINKVYDIKLKQSTKSNTPGKCGYAVSYNILTVVT